MEDGRELGEEHEHAAQRGAAARSARVARIGPVKNEAEVFDEVDEEEEEDEKMDHCWFPNKQVLDFILRLYAEKDEINTYLLRNVGVT